MAEEEVKVEEQKQEEPKAEEPKSEPKQETETKKKKKSLVAWCKEHPRVVFWTRLVLWATFAAILPFVFIANRYGIFSSSSKIKLTGWGFIAIVIIAILLIFQRFEFYSKLFIEKRKYESKFGDLVFHRTAPFLATKNKIENDLVLVGRPEHGSSLSGYDDVIKNINDNKLNNSVNIYEFVSDE